MVLGRRGSVRRDWMTAERTFPTWRVSASGARASEKVTAQGHGLEVRAKALGLGSNGLGLRLWLRMKARAWGNGLGRRLGPGVMA